MNTGMRENCKIYWNILNGGEHTIDKAKIACENSNIDLNNHFANVGKLIKHGKGGTRTIVDYKLSRYACYLITQNGDPRKEVIALAQTYFAI